MNIKTRLTYDESILNHDDNLAIIQKCEKMAKKHGLYEQVTAKISSDGQLFYNIRLYIRKCNENNDENFMYLYFQFVPGDKYFALSSDIETGYQYICENYPAQGVEFYDTLLFGLLELTGNFTTWESISDFQNAIIRITKQESLNHGMR